MTDHIYVLYRHTSPSGKAYIGITKDYTARCKSHQRCDGSAPKFHNAIRKYGWDAFTHEILLEGLTQDEAGEMEILCIAKYNTRVHGYNSHPGGVCADGVAVSKAHKGVAKTDEHRQHLADSYANSPRPLDTKIKAYMARWSKTREEAEAFYEQKANDPTSVNKYHNKGYYGYVATKKTRTKQRAALIAEGALVEPNKQVPTPDVGNPGKKSVPAFEWVSL